MYRLWRAQAFKCLQVTQAANGRDDKRQVRTRRDPVVVVWKFAEPTILNQPADNGFIKVGT